ncbi:hypothetical protein [Propionicimonas sp.]|uniref:hypothetical protein n=1 Tax=Propionicimonas sp. TaxID=1955623 RepID=UPI0025DBC256|nr:hypothetical protein [Propionicimonas sp.]MBU3977501.1 hypothetical protein [Actinomycetota bacterium]MBU3986011.1 hypothetical protein [Actinomycetota bacterium]MBU4008796.1 hypothetical protein [Actinomycetota bacterium]MBU4093502.1 hypothetical protein [Actinomycetota bacterium]MBU4160402.1 hypothetical protein [Actinomycetota bacterium]
MGPAGALIAPVVEQVLADVFARLTSQRQRDRIELLAQSAAEAYQELLAEGHRLRSDNFFDQRDGRWSAGEVAEAVFQASTNEPSLLKIPHFGRLLARFAVDSSIDAPSAHWAINEAESLTWIQYLHLAIIGRMGDLKMPPIEVGMARSQRAATVSSHRQLFDLTKWSRCLLDATPVRGIAIGEQPRELRIRQHWLSPSGKLLFEWLGLESIPVGWLEEELRVLSEDDGTDPSANAQEAFQRELRLESQ